MDYRKIDLSKWHKVGSGGTADTFACDDDSILLKLNKSAAGEAPIRNEYDRTRKVVSLGIPAPAVYEIVMAGDRFGILFQNIKNKKSYSRLIADDPDDLDEYARNFAVRAKELHAIPCDPSLFESRAEMIRKGVELAKFIAKYKPALYAFIDEMSACTTCLHGDLHTGNLIRAEGKDYWIDFDRFSYGDPTLDIAHLYTVCVGMAWLPYVRNLVHMNKKQLTRFWNVFLEEYFDSDENAIAECYAKLPMYNALDLVQRNYVHQGFISDMVTLVLVRPVVKKYCKGK